MTAQQIQQNRSTIYMLTADELLGMFRQVASEVVRELMGDMKKQIDRKDEMKPYYTREEAAEIYKVHVRTIDSWIRNGVLAAENKGNRVLILKNQEKSNTKNNQLKTTEQ